MTKSDMTLSKGEKSILDNIELKKEVLVDEILQRQIFSADLLIKLNEIPEFINNNISDVLNSDNVDYGKLTKFLNKLILEKVYISKQHTYINYMKGKLEVVKVNTKLSVMTNSFDDGEIKNGLKTTQNEITTIKMDDINGIFNIITDMIVQIKNVKDLIDTTIMAVQSQLKNVTFEYLNAGKINS